MLTVFGGTQLLLNNFFGMFHAVFANMAILTGNEYLNLIAVAATKRAM
jgi:hypothetical protein